MNRVKRRWFPKKPVCEGGARDFITIGIAEVKPALVFLLMGMGVSFAILLLELLNKMISGHFKKADDETRIKFRN